MEHETINEVRKYMEDVHQIFVDYTPHFGIWCVADKASKTVDEASPSITAIIDAFVAGFEKE